jgi:hypothetical protein
MPDFPECACLEGDKLTDLGSILTITVIELVKRYAINCYTDRPTEMAPDSSEITADSIVVSTSTTELGRYEEALGVERRKIDNSRSTSCSRRRLRVQRTWSRKVEIFFEKATTRSGSVGLGIQAVGGLKAKAESCFRDMLALSGEEAQIFEEEIEVTVPARTNVEVLLHWKTIWQEGMSAVKLDNGETYKVPYRITIGMTFDQENRDL